MHWNNYRLNVYKTFDPGILYTIKTDTISVLKNHQLAFSYSVSESWFYTQRVVKVRTFVHPTERKIC